jgi:predicted ATPase
MPAIAGTAEIQPDEVLDLLSQLVNKSLVTKDRPARGQARYRLLETIKQFAAQRLDAPESGVLGDRHCTFFTLVAERAESYLRGPNQLEWLDRLDADHDNLRAALSWSLADEAHDPSLALRLVAALALLGHSRFFERGRDLVHTCPERVSDSKPCPRPRPFRRSNVRIPPGQKRGCTAPAESSARACTPIG